MKKRVVATGLFIVMAILAIPIVFASSVSNTNVPDGGNSVHDAVGTDACRVTALVYWVNGVKQPTVPVTGPLDYNIYINAGDTVAFKVKCSGPGYAFIRNNVTPFHQYKEIPAAGAWFRSTEAYMALSPGQTRQFWVNTGRKGDSYGSMNYGNIYIYT